MSTVFQYSVLITGVLISDIYCIRNNVGHPLAIELDSIPFALGLVQVNSIKLTPAV